MDSITQEIKYFVYLALFNAGSRQFWPYMLIYVAIAFYIIRLSMLARHKPVNLSAFLVELLPAAIYAHPSFRMDIKFYLINFIVIRLGLVSVVIAATAVISAAVVNLFLPLLASSAINNAPSASAGPTVSDRIVFTIVSVIILDFGYFLAHYLSHRVPALWAFHQIHHAAEHLTPITASRFHPVDYLWTIFISTLLGSLVVSIFSLYHATEVQLITVLNLSVAFLVFHVLSNFRHSHIWISFGPRLSRVLVSPCMHQIHHSTALRHIDKNYGLIFSIWDRWFNSLYIPKQREDFDMGLGNKRLTSRHSMWRHLLLPMSDCFKNIKNGRWWIN